MENSLDLRTIAKQYDYELKCQRPIASHEPYRTLQKYQSSISKEEEGGGKMENLRSKNCRLESWSLKGTKEKKKRLLLRRKKR